MSVTETAAHLDLEARLDAMADEYRARQMQANEWSWQSFRDAHNLRETERNKIMGDWADRCKPGGDLKVRVTVEKKPKRFYSFAEG